MTRLRTAGLRGNYNMRLKIARLTMHWNQYDLASIAGVAQSRISLIETGRVQPSQRERERISNALSRLPEELFDDK